MTVVSPLRARAPSSCEGSCGYRRLLIDVEYYYHQLLDLKAFVAEDCDPYQINGDYRSARVTHLCRRAPSAFCYDMSWIPPRISEWSKASSFFLVVQSKRRVFSERLYFFSSVAKPRLITPEKHYVTQMRWGLCAYRLLSLMTTRSSTKGKKVFKSDYIRYATIGTPGQYN